MRYLSLAFAALFVAALAAAKWEHRTPIANLVQAAQTAPEPDRDACLALAAKMDAGEAGKRKVTKQEQHSYDDCVVRYNCYKVKASEAPPGTYDTSVSRMRYMIKMCENQK